MIKFISFGSGSSGNCYYLFTETDGLLIDTGVGLRNLKKRFKDYGLTLSSVHNILITHDHADHSKSSGSISHEFNLPVFATQLVHKGIEKNYCVRRKIDATLKNIIEKGTTYNIGEFKVTPFDVPHDSTDNVGYFIQAGSTTFCLVTDVGHVTEEIRGYISKANYLVIEANHDEDMLKRGSYPEYLKRRIMGPTGHLSNRNCALTLAACITPQLHHVWLCHLSEENNHPELARKTIETVLSEHGVSSGKDFVLDVLGRTTPNGIYDLV